MYSPQTEQDYRWKRHPQWPLQWPTPLLHHRLPKCNVGGSISQNNERDARLLERGVCRLALLTLALRVTRSAPLTEPLAPMSTLLEELAFVLSLPLLPPG